MKDVSDDVMKGTSEDTELVELGEVTEATKGPGFGPNMDANFWPRPWL